MINTDNIDRFGHCVICHKNLITKRVVDGKVIEMFLPIHDHTDFMLDNGSIMKVCVCKPCKENTDLNASNIHSDIMDAVQKGWKLEVKSLIDDESQPNWTEETGKKYLDKMAELNINCYSENMDKANIESKQVELSKSKFEKIKLEKLNVTNIDS